MNAAAASAPVKIEVLARKDNGGGTIRIPIMRPGPITLSNGRVQHITVENFREMVANFPTWKGPVPIHTGRHRDIAAGETHGKAPGYITGIEVAGDSLMGTMDLGPELFHEIMAEEAWRGFSCDAWSGVKDHDGWVLVGGVWTNRPHYDINVAADSAVKPTEFLRSHLSFEPGSGEGEPMDVQKLQADLATAQAALTTKDKEIETLKAAAKTAEETAAKATTDLATLSASHTELKGTVEALKLNSTRLEVDQFVKEQLAAGVPASMFDASKHENDRMKWFIEGWPKGNLDTLKQVSASVPKQKSGPSSSGPAPTESGPADAAVRLAAEAHKLAAAEKITFVEALDRVRAEKPELNAEAMAPYRPEAA